MARFFFALWPDEDAAQSLGALSLRLAGQAGGKAVSMQKIHLTLAFLGELEAARRESACEAAATLAGDVFEAALDCVGSFRGARVGWAGMQVPPRALLELQRALEAALLDRGFALEERAFTPHVTLVRNIRRPIARAAVAPIAWGAREFALVRSETGTGRYVNLEKWPLRAS